VGSPNAIAIGRAVCAVSRREPRHPRLDSRLYFNGCSRTTVKAPLTFSATNSIFSPAFT
jgi:hypothetical protein